MTHHERIPLTSDHTPALLSSPTPLFFFPYVIALSESLTVIDDVMVLLIHGLDTK